MIKFDWGGVTASQSHTSLVPTTLLFSTKEIMLPNLRPEVYIWPTSYYNTRKVIAKSINK